MTTFSAATVGCALLAFSLASGLAPDTHNARSVPAGRRIIVPAGTLSGNVRWSGGAVYEIAGELRLANGATLTIDAGARIEAFEGSRIVVPRTSRIAAIGTPLQPVVFSCVGSDRYSGCWGGIVIQGNAPINGGQPTSPAARGNGQAGCRELVDAEVGGFYGGCDAADSSGALRYVRIEYAEFDGLRLEGVGSRTALEYVQLNRGLSTGLAVAGGTVNFKHFVFTANGGTGLVWSAGWTGKAQFLLMQLDLARGIMAVGGMSGENSSGSSMDNLPRSAPAIYNVSILTVLPPNPGSVPTAVLLHNGTAGEFGNLLVYKPPVGLNIKGASTCAQIANAALRLTNSAVVGATALGDPDSDPSPCAGLTSPDVESQWLQLPANGNEIITTPAQVEQLLKGPGELITLDGRPTVALSGATNPPTDGFFDANAAYVGAIPPIVSGPSMAIPWHSGWTAPAPVPPPTPPGTVIGVAASLQSGPLTGIVVSGVGTGVQASSSATGAFTLSALPAGPLEVASSGYSAECRVPDAIRTWVPVNGTGQVAVLATCGVSGAAVDVSAGGNHTCAITSTGAGKCWGSNSTGQVGDGTSGNVRVDPAALAGETVHSGISAGEISHSCGLTPSGAVECWGVNARTSPTLVHAFVAFRSFALGANHTCAITVAGAAYCWGQNTAGQLGNSGAATDGQTPVAVGGGNVFTQVGAGLQHSCAITPAGAAWCWGTNALGQAGDGTLGNVRTSPVAVIGGHAFAAITAGGEHSCGLKSNGETWCWGSNTWGQLGNGSAGSPSGSPVQVLGGMAFARIEAGTNHTCALTATGVAYCWGANFAGQLGDNTTTNRNVPQLVQGGLSLTAIASGGQHTCGVTTAGALYCWGWNGSGQLGVGTGITRSLVPVPVPFP